MRRFWIASAAALLLAHPALAASQSAQHEAPRDQSGPRPAPIDRNGVLILIRSTLLALNQANETGNYTVLRDLAAPSFAAANSAARLGEIFASQRAQRLDLSGVAVLDPQLTLMPQIESNGQMRMAGFFPSVPSQVNFEFLFAPVDGHWRVFGLAVNVGTSTPVAPTPAPPPGGSQPKSATGPKSEGSAPPKDAAAPPRGGRPVRKPEPPTDVPLTGP